MGQLPKQSNLLIDFKFPEMMALINNFTYSHYLCLNFLGSSHD